MVVGPPSGIFGEGGSGVFDLQNPFTASADHKWPLASDNVWSPVGQLLGKWVAAIQSLKAGGGGPTEAGYDVRVTKKNAVLERCWVSNVLVLQTRPKSQVSSPIRETRLQGVVADRKGQCNGAKTKGEGTGAM